MREDKEKVGREGDKGRMRKRAGEKIGKRERIVR